MLTKEWEEICKNKSWNDDNRYKPRIVNLVENFEKQFQNIESAERTACLAVSMYLFGPIDDEDELELYLGIIMRRIRDYRNKPAQ